MKAKFCLPIIVKTKREVLKKITDHKNQYDLFEVWISQVSDVDDIFVSALIKNLQGKLIIVFRNPNGKVTMEKEERENIISLCNNSKVLVDIDFENQKEDIRFIEENKLNIKIILSFHNYEETPHNLIEIVDSMEKEKFDILKVSTKCKSNADTIKLLGLLIYCKKRGLKSVILGMGKFGISTRIFGSLWGNEIIFAPVNKKEASAPGQLTKEQLENIFSIIEKGK
jgi:3-dehydroquinate dehydratase type I